MKLEVGKYYRTGDGRKVGPLERNRTGNEFWPFECGDMFFDDEGSSCRVFGDVKYAREKGQHDLIEPWTEDTGTLAEIGARVGDVVEVTQWLGSMFSKGDTGVVISGFSHFKGRFGIDSGAGQFRIISRAKPQPPGPVITETVTTKRIVPGVYGVVAVGEDHTSQGRVGLYINSMLTRADLIAARDVFNQLIEAMEE